VKVFEVWEWDETALNAAGWHVGTFETREKAQGCVDELRNKWHSRRIKEVEVK
jgi:hypothetical protein